MPRAQSVPAIAKVIQEIVRVAPWVESVSYGAHGDTFQATVILPADVTLETMMRKRKEMLDRLDELKV
jgi:hypothetical protein